MKICPTVLIIIEVLFTPTFTIPTIKATAAAATAPAPAPATTTIKSKHLGKNNVTEHHVEGNSEIISHTIKNPPIIIQTLQRNYEEPTLTEYEECHEKLKKCQEFCNQHSNRTACELDKCPICPILLDNQILIQGVNDTNSNILDIIHQKANRNVNTTNVIHLTNDIHNIIDNRLGNVTNNNINNVNIHHNISRMGVAVGGKYGFGYDNDGESCCLLIYGRQCKYNGYDDHKNYQYHYDHDYNGDNSHYHRQHHRHGHEHGHGHGIHYQRHHRCRFKHQRVCGKKCSSRIIQAKRIQLCEHNLDDMNEINYVNSNNCHIIIRYVPYQSAHHRHSVKSHFHRTSTKCHFQPYWPYIFCSKLYNGRNFLNSMCRYCYHYPYGYILYYGLPQHCQRCFSPHSYEPNFNGVQIPSFIWPWNHFEGPFINDYTYNDVEGGHNYNIDNENWIVNKTTCTLEDGTLSNECIELIWNDNKEYSAVTEYPIKPENRANNAIDVDNDGVVDDNNDMDNYIDINDDEDDDVISTEKERHSLFKRSKYSHRYKN